MEISISTTPKTFNKTVLETALHIAALDVSKVTSKGNVVTLHCADVTFDVLAVLAKQFSYIHATSFTLFGNGKGVDIQIAVPTSIEVALPVSYVPELDD